MNELKNPRKPLWRSIHSLFPALSGKYHLYALDLRGHGRSGHPPGAYRLGNYTRDIYQFIVQQVRTPAFVYGHSLGALIAMQLAARQPQSVRALILGDPPLYHHDTRTQDTFWFQAFQELLDFMLDHPDSKERGAWLVQNFPNMSPDRREERLRSLEGLDPDVLRAVISNDLMEGVSLSALVTQITCPALLLCGNPELGSALRAQDVDFALKNFPDIQLLEMETVGHGILPADLLPQVLAFLDRCQAHAMR
jgi:pimeloyl-ACP methyl ester carboxylesterase